jgi:hypothetical protein
MVAGLRHIGGFVAVVCALAGATDVMPGGVGRAATLSPSFASRFNVRLTVAPDLSALAHRALVNETEKIWRNARVRIHWLSGATQAESAQALRVLVTTRPAAAHVDGSRWAVGELLRFDGNGAIAIASIAGARRIVNETRAPGGAELQDVLDHRLGVVLGRAVAHEIGHYLLNTNTHASRGLMRATFDSREFADLRGGVFDLDEEAGARLRAASDPAALSPVLLPLRGFSYNDR